MTLSNHQTSDWANLVNEPDQFWVSWTPSIGSWIRLSWFRGSSLPANMGIWTNLTSGVEPLFLDHGSDFHNSENHPSHPTCHFNLSNFLGIEPHVLAHGSDYSHFVEHPTGTTWSSNQINIRGLESLVLDHGSDPSINRPSQHGHFDLSDFRSIKIPSHGSWI